MVLGSPKEKSKYRSLDDPIAPITDDQRIAVTRCCKKYAQNTDEESLFLSILLSEEHDEVAESA
jgi:hypothetical protein